MDDLRGRLRRLGVMTGRDFKPRPRTRRGGDIDSLVDGETVATPDGNCFRVRRVFEPGWRHGPLPLGDWLAQDAALVARLGNDPLLAQTDPSQFIFLDTETTGLGGGALAFLVGIGAFNETGEFEVRQYFLRDPAEEAAMLNALDEILRPGTALVTFNGRTFDVPLLGSRYVMARRCSPIGTLPNLDLLHLARRLWQRRLPSCALGALEASVLGVSRTEADVPSPLIPYLYRQYLQTRDAREMVRVLYHNEMDLLSMVVLGVTIYRAFTQPDAPDLHTEDRLSVARWYARQGMTEEAEAAYDAAARSAPDAETRRDALCGLAYLLKRNNRREEALPLWVDMANLKLDTVGHEELAKHYEWQALDVPRALEWTEQAIRLAESWRPGWQRTQALNALHHRRERLLRKLDGSG